MDFKTILKTVGTGLITTLVPGGNAIISGINAFLPDDKKLPDNATGTQAQNAINQMTPEVQAQILSKQHDVTIEEIRGFTDRFKTMADVDKSGNTTRPFIALLMAWIVAFTVVVVISMYAYAIANGESEMILSINESWPMLTAIIATPTALLRAYFAMRTKEKQQKYEAATGVSAAPSIISALLNKG